MDERRTATDRAAAEREVADEHRSGRDPHHELNNPVDDPDPTEFPDPYEKRPDPRGPGGADNSGHPADAEADADTDPAPRDPSTSDPPPPRNREQARREGFER